MRIDILTLFEEMFEGFLNTSIIKSAIERNLVCINTHNIRSYSKDKHKKVDDTPYGGGSGMVLMCQPIFDAVEDLKKENTKVVLLTPQGKKYNQKMAYKLSKEEHLLFICGHYEGFDERIRSIADEEISIGDYVLTGGELPSMVITDSIVRLIDGVIDESSHLNDSFNNNKLDYPTYTKPRNYKGLEVPDVLVSGNHEKIKKWREEESIKRTNERRPDLNIKYCLYKSKLDAKIKIDELEGFLLNPKNNAKRLDAITIKNLKIIDSEFIFNVAKKNIDKKLKQLLVLMMNALDTDDEEDDALVIDESLRLKSLINNEYLKLLTDDYKASVIDKIDYVIDEFKRKKNIYENTKGRSR